MTLFARSLALLISPRTISATQPESQIYCLRGSVEKAFVSHDVKKIRMVVAPSTPRSRSSEIQLALFRPPQSSLSYRVDRPSRLDCLRQVEANQRVWAFFTCLTGRPSGPASIFLPSPGRTRLSWEPRLCFKRI
ncbi:hypothetical protein F5B20DRAFT_528312 [Whalleya microplaca]|nr:hypothetical protein F5B20DRAFT_528312 [Whalleya microplaca]